jgi:DNA-binding HxlR family transcriptional regulator
LLIQLRPLISIGWQEIGTIPSIRSGYISPHIQAYIIGERWTILILRDLIVGGARKFQDFERSLAGISPNTLSARLKRLEDAGIVERRFYEQHPPRAEYVLTEKGKDLRPVLRALLDWGQHHTKYRATAK